MYIEMNKTISGSFLSIEKICVRFRLPLSQITQWVEIISKEAFLLSLTSIFTKCFYRFHIVVSINISMFDKYLVKLRTYYRIWNRRSPLNKRSHQNFNSFLHQSRHCGHFSIFFSFNFFQKLINVPLCLFRSLEYSSTYSPGMISRLFTALSEWGISAQQIPDDLMAKQVL